jgi:hypothetical protein
MNPILSPEEAKLIDLPFNPVVRHRRVREYIRVLGRSSDTDILINPSGTAILGERTLIVNTLTPFLGRSALVKVAKGLDSIEDLEAPEM